MHRMLWVATLALSVAFANLPTGSQAQAITKQMKLTEKHIKGFIAAQNEISAAVEKLEDGLSSDHARYEAELDAIARKHGFRSLADYDVVAGNISVVTAAIDPRTRVFTDPPTAIKNEIEAVKADDAVPSDEKKLLLEELAAALRASQSIRFPANIELVKKYYDKLELAMVGTSLDQRSTLSFLPKSSD